MPKSATNVFRFAGARRHERQRLAAQPATQAVAQRQDLPARADPYPLEAVESALLCRTLQAWNELAPTGRFRLGRDGNENDLLARPDLVAPTSTIVMVSTADVTDWRFSHWGEGMQVFDSERFLARRVGDFPAPAIVAATAKDLARLVSEGRPGVSRISGPTPHGPALYDRLFLPIVFKSGIVRFVTVADIILPDATLPPHRHR